MPRAVWLVLDSLGLGAAPDAAAYGDEGADTFGPMGPVLVRGVDYNKLHLIGRHNGKVVQESTTDQLIFSIDNIVSYISRYVTLEPGDVIFTGTPGTTQAMKPGDTFEVEIEGVGILRNKVVAEQLKK